MNTCFCRRRDCQLWAEGLTRGIHSTIFNAEYGLDLNVIIPGVFPIRSQGMAQNSWAMQLALAQPFVLFSILAIAAAELQA